MTTTQSSSAKSRAEKIAYLKSITSVRDTTGKVFDKIKTDGQGNYYALNLDKMNDVVKFVCEEVIKKDYPQGNYDDIPPHGRWQHLDCNGVQRVEKLISQWRQSGVDEIEICRKLIDLFMFSVLIDAGAGNTWKYTETFSNSKTMETGRSEGLAVASYYLFVNGDLSNDPQSDPYKVNGAKLVSWDMQKHFLPGFQVSETNPLAGTEGRLNLIKRLGQALVSNKEIFGQDGRPGNLIDYLYKHKSPSSSSAKGNIIDLSLVWKALMDGLTSIWPAGRLTVDGESIGDAWSLDTITSEDGLSPGIVTFHKLTQWLCYSLLVPMEKYGYKFVIENKSLQTGLPEYRNGGLFYDLEVITLKPDVFQRGMELTKKLNNNASVPYEIPTFTPEDGAIVEWRCLTIGLLDYLLPMVNEYLGYEMALPQLIEAGSWKGGRITAGSKRPLINGGPPIDLHSDGTVF